jgi:Methyltransferase domain
MQLKVTTSRNHDSEYHDHDIYALAKYESYGFFDDIAQSQWRLLQQNAIATPHHLQPDRDKVSSYFYRPRGWYQNNWEPDFSCPHEKFLGPIRDGHKWVCDPHRLERQGPDCLVYSFGSNGNFDFEQAVLEVAPQCELHVFDPGHYEYKMKQNAVLKNANAHYHTFGLKASYATDNSRLDEPNRLPPGAFQPFPEIIQQLGHQGRTVSIFKIDIEKGEWTTFRDWAMNVNVTWQQILVEVHGAPRIANDFFATQHQSGSYAMFHKEPNIQFAGGDCVEFGFIKMRPSFFQNDTMPVDHSPQALAHAAANQQEYAMNKIKADYDYGREMRGTGVV